MSPAKYDFNDRMLGKGVVQCADTPGFLGNRVGVFALQAAVHEAVALVFESEVGRGTSVKVMLPFVESDDQAEVDRVPSAEIPVERIDVIVAENGSGNLADRRLE